MSGVSGVSSGNNMEMLAVAMTKRANDAQGEAVLSLLQGAAESTQQIQAASPANNGRLGSNIDIRV